MNLTNHKIFKTSEFIMVIYEYSKCLYKSIIFWKSNNKPFTSPLFTSEEEAINYALIPERVAA
jgi:hypothetical protein